MRVNETKLIFERTAIPFDMSFEKIQRPKPFNQPSRKPLLNYEKILLKNREKNTKVQAKLKIGSPTDKYEKEADQVADKVVQNSNQNSKAGNSKISSRPASNQSVQRSISKIEGKVAGSASAVGGDVSSTLSSSKGKGSKMEPTTKQDMESSFGRDFNGVNIHTGSEAIQMNQKIGAKAFTNGNDIYFNKGAYNPSSNEGKHLLAHELTHTVQQGGESGTVQRSLLNPPTTPEREGKELTPEQVQTAIAYNQKRHTDIEEISLIRDILGLSPEPKVIDEDFIRAIADYQTNFGLAIDGKIGKATADRLAREIIAEANFIGKGDLGNLSGEFVLKSALSTLIKSGNVNYADYKLAIADSTMIQKLIVLHDKALLKEMRDALAWNDFAKCIELLGYSAPTYNSLIRNSAVKATIQQAWNDSDVAQPVAGVTTQHEEGGWVYLNLISGTLLTQRAARGAGAAIDLSAPPIVANSVVVAKFHTHPNLGGGWNPAPSPADIRVDALHGVPDIVIGSPDLDPLTYQLYSSGPNRRLHLAGDRGLPGAAGGISPQGKYDGSYDKQ